MNFPQILAHPSEGLEYYSVLVYIWSLHLPRVATLRGTSISQTVIGNIDLDFGFWNIEGKISTDIDTSLLIWLYNLYCIHVFVALLTRTILIIELLLLLYDSALCLWPKVRVRVRGHFSFFSGESNPCTTWWDALFLLFVKSQFPH